MGEAFGVLELECATQCRGCCYDRATPTYVVRKGSWMHPQTATEVARGPTPTVILIGGTGVGKSNLGNFLVGRTAFVSRNSPESVTTSPSVVDGTWFGGREPLRVMDCAGIGDTKGDAADESQWDMALRVLEKVGSVHALILVMKAGRFTQFEKNIISRLRERFGPGFWKHLCIFYTGATAKPEQLNLARVAPELKRRLFQVEIERCGDCDALQDIQAIRLYGADLDPCLCSPEAREREFRLKRALKDLELEELLEIDRRIPSNVLEMTDHELDKFMTGPAAEAWIQGNYFQLGVSRLLGLKAAIESMDSFSVRGLRDGPPPLQAPPPPPELERPGSEDDVTYEEISHHHEMPPQLPPSPHAGAGLVDPEAPYSPSAGSASSQQALLRPHLSQSNPEDEVPQSAGSPKYHPNMESIRRALLEADTVVVRGPWVDKVCVNNGGLLPKREDLLAEAIWDADISYSKNGRHFYLL